MSMRRAIEHLTGRTIVTVRMNTDTLGYEMVLESIFDKSQTFVPISRETMHAIADDLPEDRKAAPA